MTKEKIEEIARRRGFFWQSSEIYGGLSGFYDYAHLGTLMKRKWENLWRDFFLNLSDDFFEIDTVNVMPENVFLASGHLKSFVDPIVKCKKCKNMERADHIIEENLKENFEGLTPKELDDLIKKHNIKCPKCNGELEEVGILNMMFPLDVGFDTKAYLRPETAQGVYVNFRREFESLRKRLPFGLAIIGKAYRNEISPRNLLMRMREFTQAELQIFFDPEKIEDHEKFHEVSKYPLRLFPVEERKHNKIVELTCDEAVKRLHLPKFYVYHLAKVQQFYLDLIKIPKELFRFRQLSDEEKAFYNKYHWDMELYMENLGGFKEIGGVHYRTDNDLKGHENISKQDMIVFVDGRKFIPHVLELSFGVDRNVYALMELFYKEEKDRSLFTFPRILSPYDCAIFPLVNKDNIPEKSAEVKKLLHDMKFSIFFDDSGSIGRRYRRMDEIGVPCCVTVDHKTLEDDTVTLRDRDSMKQVRVKIKDLRGSLYKFLQGEEIEKLGQAVTKSEE
ncbi:MAG: glycine--tRNA ligase [Candidatus Aenigmarchaeota archaeon]|nr:glycine--tRNA ligase [Candidatus Aenigmarchaeota archaeon]